MADPNNLDELTRALAGARRGEEESFGTLYRSVQPGMLRYLRILVGDDAEDVASETWLHIVRDLASFRGDGNGFRGWAVTIARHRAMDHLRHHRRRPVLTVPTEALIELPGRHDTPTGAGESISTDAALALIATLPPDQAEAVLLRVVVGLDAESAARVLGKRAGAVRTAAYRGLRRLAQLIAPATGE
ncbi:RNA polymerase sigma-70 factor (ECF subfamily) [Allocatelliglobosispora scoriae]|uniref:RNA polymerase sigma-70 factor (ECF subfamily) n=1 Tax=Allocatelliglobosispora scoriae TaxID=643052 RepID=A0A841BGA4_9ACTN|nr:RNA polymerase sigma factor [Allocatelliglobosispora scoriae]MBB5868117.1 RNA polymerase sigma-70 factor (ECF subfamily) [Allocatelliglobosispora scoriae]